MRAGPEANPAERTAGGGLQGTGASRGMVDRGSDHIACLTGLYPAVSHTFLLREVTALRAAGARVTTCSVNRPDPAHLIGPEERAAAGSTFYVLDAARRPAALLAAAAWAARRPRRLARAVSGLRHGAATGLRGPLRQIAYLGEAMVLARHLERRGVTRIHNQLGLASASVAMHAAALAGIPFSMTLHGPDEFRDTPAPLLASRIRAADMVACISGFCRNRARERSDPADWPKLRIVRCGIDPALYDGRGRAAPLRHILFVGRLVPVKGVSLLLDAFGGIATAFPDATLTVVGDGGERAALHRQADRLDLGRRIVFAGALDQRGVAARMARADLLVLPSFAEGLPVVLMEAMAAGLPVIASDVAGTPELVEHGVTGTLVAPGDASRLAQAIAACLADPAPALAMARRGRDRAIRQHDMWQEGRRLLSLFPRPD